MIYFIRNMMSEMVKIGFSTNPEHRLQILQVGSCDELVLALVLPGDKVVEKTLHDSFRKYHYRGEWYKFTGELADFIYANLDEIEEEEMELNA